MSNKEKKRDLSSLPPEMFAEVIRNCHPKDVAHMRQTCKGAKHFCDSRDVQKSVLQKLDVTQAPNITPYDRLDKLSAEQMASKVAKAVESSDRWQDSGENKGYAEEASLRITPHTQHYHGNSDEWTASMRPRLLPGGRYALLVNGEDLQLWSLEHSTRVWVAEPPHANFRICDTFDFELLQGGKVLIIATKFSNLMDSERFVCVYKFDFASQKGTCVFKCGVPSSFLSPQLMVRGELVMVLFTPQNQIILFNWKKSEAVKLDYHRRVNTASLVENHHIVIVLKAEDEDLKVVAISISSLDGKWTNVRHHSNWAQWKCVKYSFSGENNRDVIRLRLPNQSGGNVWRRILGMHAFTPAWYPKTRTNNPGIAEIFVAAYEKLEDDSQYLLSYRIQLSGHAVGAARRAVAAPDLSLVSEDRAILTQQSRDPLELKYDITNAGRMFARYGPNVYYYELFCKDKQPVGYGQIPGIEDSVFDEENEPMVMSVEPVSSAVLIGSDALLRVARFGS
ncbi:hypothetical protein DFH11DRAFT_1316461 [Phellopilus nigrolimitatus]|nr:hypothetical protein DFH11DRAFT_1316461 [Phellopilus nigrolimitatus]